MTKKLAAKPEKKYHHGDLPTRLVEESLILLRESGVHNFGLRELATRAGVSHTAPYRHFESKDAIFVRIAEEGFRLLKSQVDQKTALCALDPEKQLGEFLQAYLSFIFEEPEYSQMMFGQVLVVDTLEKNAAFVSARSSFVDTLTQIVRNCQLTNLLNAHEKTETLVAQIWSVVHGFSNLKKGGGIAVSDAILPQMIQTFLELPGRDKKKSNPLFGR